MYNYFLVFDILVYAKVYGQYRNYEQLYSYLKGIIPLMLKQWDYSFVYIFDIFHETCFLCYCLQISKLSKFKQINAFLKSEKIVVN